LISLFFSPLSTGLLGLTYFLLLSCLQWLDCCLLLGLDTWNNYWIQSLIDRLLLFSPSMAGQMTFSWPSRPEKTGLHISLPINLAFIGWINGFNLASFAWNKKAYNYSM
jgi:hypothetical protein